MFQCFVIKDNSTEYYSTKDIFLNLFVYCWLCNKNRINAPLVVIKDGFNQRKMFTSTIVFKKEK